MTKSRILELDICGKKILHRFFGKIMDTTEDQSSKTEPLNEKVYHLATLLIFYTQTYSL